MTLPEAIAAHAAPWVSIWLKVLVAGGIVLPLALLIWRQTRVAAVAAVAAGVLGGLGTDWLYHQLGYVKLLGLAHIVVWTPLMIYFWLLLREDLPQSARWILWLVMATILISLAFDYSDVARYIAGNRTPLAAAG